MIFLLRSSAMQGYHLDMNQNGKLIQIPKQKFNALEGENAGLMLIAQEPETVLFRKSVLMVNL